MEYTFSAKGHPNILSTQKNTLEITKDKELSLNGDCIIAVEADFSPEEIKKFLGCDWIRLKIAVAGLADEITARPNKLFNSNHEIVFRKGDYASERTLGLRADKSAKDLDRKLVAELQKKSNVIITVNSQ